MTNTDTTPQSVLDNVELVSVMGRQWTGRKKLRPEDLQLGDGGKLPSDDLISLGIKKVIDVDRLKPFARLKKRAERLCESQGVRFLGGFAIPKERAKHIAEELEEIKLEYMDEVRDFMNEYRSATDDWCAAHPEFEEALRRAVPVHGWVKDRFSFNYAIYSVAGGEQSGDLDKQAASLGDRLLEEVARKASEALESMEKAKTKTFRSTGPLKSIREKLNGLAFLDPSSFEMVSSIDTLLQECENTKKFEGMVYHKVLSTYLILSDPEMVRSHGKGLLSIANMAQESMTGIPVVSAPPAEEAPQEFVSDNTAGSSDVVAEEIQKVETANYDTVEAGQTTSEETIQPVSKPSVAGASDTDDLFTVADAAETDFFAFEDEVDEELSDETAALVGVLEQAIQDDIAPKPADVIQVSPTEAETITPSDLKKVGDVDKEHIENVFSMMTGGNADKEPVEFVEGYATPVLDVSTSVSLNF